MSILETRRQESVTCYFWSNLYTKLAESYMQISAVDLR